MASEYPTPSWNDNDRVYLTEAGANAGAPLCVCGLYKIWSPVACVWVCPVYVSGAAAAVRLLEIFRKR